MAPMKSLLCTAALILGTLILIPEFQQAEAGVPCGNFEYSCNTFGFDGSTGVLTAQCYANNGSLVGASINLNQFLGNNNGNLVYVTDFTDTCSSLTAYPQANYFYITGYCYDVNWHLEATSYDISYQVANDDGTLTWTYCN